MTPLRAALTLCLLSAFPAPAALATDCDPRSAAEWAALCVADRDSVEDLIDEIRRFPGLEDVESFSDARELLATGSFGGDCRKALRQLLAAALNLASGRLSGDCCVEHRDGRTRSLREALHRHADNCGARRDCSDALRFLRRINDDTRVHDCGDGGDDDRDHDDDRGHGDRDDDDGDWRDRDGQDDEDGCCRPRSRGWWHRQCLGADRVSPTRGQSGAEGPGAHPQLDEEDRERAIRRARRRLDRADLRPCTALDSKNLGGQQGKAEAEVAALALNWGAGFLDGCSRAERLVDGAIRALDDGRWREAWEKAHDGNHAKGLRRCDGDRDDPEDRDGDEGANDGSKSKGKSQGKGKAKGKKK
jgi:hypothetical protein